MVRQVCYSFCTEATLGFAHQNSSLVGYFESPLGLGELLVVVLAVKLPYDKGKQKKTKFKYYLIFELIGLYLSE